MHNVIYFDWTGQVLEIVADQKKRSENQVLEIVVDLKREEKIRGNIL